LSCVSDLKITACIQTADKCHEQAKHILDCGLKMDAAGALKTLLHDVKARELRIQIYTAVKTYEAQIRIFLTDVFKFFVNRFI
jgi:hypothetical protein